MDQKEKMKARVIDFVQDFIQHRTFKSLIKHMKRDLPKLLGYSNCEVMMYDNPNNNLYCMSITENDQELSEEHKKDFEREFIIDEKSVVRFPPNMGITGYALKGDAVCYLNNF